MTDFHPESWNPLWSIGTILTGLVRSSATHRFSYLSSTTSLPSVQSTPFASSQIFAYLQFLDALLIFKALGMVGSEGDEQGDIMRSPEMDSNLVEMRHVNLISNWVM